MNGTIVARVRRVLFSPEGRALVHAVTDAGLEPKLEVAASEVQGIVPGGDYTLTLTWTLEPVAVATPAQPAAPAAQPAPAAQTQTPLPSAVDEEFMRLMARPRGRVQAAVGGALPQRSGGGEPTATVAAELAQRLGIRPPRTTS
jgi:hypothetical protein